MPGREDDLISRASVLKAIDEYERLSAVSQTVRNMTSLREVVQWLPSAEPEKRTEERTETHACDSISRAAAIEAMDGFNACGYVEEPFERLEKALKEIPPAQPERKTGRWTPQDHNRRNGYVTTTVYFYPKCSECGHSGNYGMSYCPNCGARMEEQDE